METPTAAAAETLLGGLGPCATAELGAARPGGGMRPGDRDSDAAGAATRKPAAPANLNRPTAAGVMVTVTVRPL